MKSERDLFEEWHNKEYMDKLEWDSKKEEYKDYIDEVMWQTWQASAQREGYKLMPCEPTYKQLDALKNSCELFKKAGVSDLEAHGAYKAMIRASE